MLLQVTSTLSCWTRGFKGKGAEKRERKRDTERERGGGGREGEGEGEREGTWSSHLELTDAATAACRTPWTYLPRRFADLPRRRLLHRAGWSWQVVFLP
jgi:hypothetical protein